MPPANVYCVCFQQSNTELHHGGFRIIPRDGAVWGAQSSERRTTPIKLHFPPHRKEFPPALTTSQTRVNSLSHFTPQGLTHCAFCVRLAT